MARKVYDAELLRYLLRSIPKVERDYAEFALTWVAWQAVNPRFTDALRTYARDVAHCG